MKTQSVCPKSFIENDFEKFFPISNDDKIERIWNQLQRRETFIQGQIPPYNVEFETGETFGQFHEGELNIHHGPLLSVHGSVGKVTNEYRSLDYFYGSYVLSFRLIRPTKLEFFREEDGIRVKIKSYVKPWFEFFWSIGNQFFWTLFQRTLNAPMDYSTKVE